MILSILLYLLYYIVCVLILNLFFGNLYTIYINKYLFTIKTIVCENYKPYYKILENYSNESNYSLVKYEYTNYKFNVFNVFEYSLNWFYYFIPFIFLCNVLYIGPKENEFTIDFDDLDRELENIKRNHNDSLEEYYEFWYKHNKTTK